MMNKITPNALRVGILSMEPERLTPVLDQCGDLWTVLESITEDSVEEFDYFISYGHRKIIPGSITAKASERILNLHISYLPWNRGADPNFWSFFDDTPKGVSIHFIDAGIDTGPLLAQEPVSFDHNETLKSSYHFLKFRIEQLFEAIWPAFRSGNIRPTPQPQGGSFHTSAELRSLWASLPLKYDTRVSEISELGVEYRFKNDTKVST